MSLYSVNLRYTEAFKEPVERISISYVGKCVYSAIIVLLSMVNVLKFQTSSSLYSQTKCWLLELDFVEYLPE